MVGIGKTKGVPVQFGPFLARKRVQDARQSVAATKDALREESSENRAAYERFYNNLAIFSGGTIALSITYLEYLKSASKPVLYQNLLSASWACFLICLGLALFYSFFYAHYGHYARLRELHQKQQKQCETELETLPQLNIADLPSSAERRL